MSAGVVTPKSLIKPSNESTTDHQFVVTSARNLMGNSDVEMEQLVSCNTSSYMPRTKSNSKTVSPRKSIPLATSKHGSRRKSVGSMKHLVTPKSASQVSTPKLHAANTSATTTCSSFVGTSSRNLLPNTTSIAKPARKDIISFTSPKLDTQSKPVRFNTPALTTVTKTPANNCSKYRLPCQPFIVTPSKNHIHQSTVNSKSSNVVLPTINHKPKKLNLVNTANSNIPAKYVVTLSRQPSTDHQFIVTSARNFQLQSTPAPKSMKAVAHLQTSRHIIEL
eukprot:710071_1